MQGKKPILILQMQRMGDLILSYPLVIWLSRRYPEHPIHIVAEESFSTPLMKLSPSATYFSWSKSDTLKQQPYELVINLSIQPKAARLAYDVKTEHKIGPVLSPEGHTYVHGQWQLYRTSLVKNNLYNRFHWADLNALDIIPYNDMACTNFSLPRTLPDEANKVGLFIGASAKAKRPSPQFWAELIDQLLQKGLRPILLGGPAEVPAGKEIERLSQLPVLNLCGKLRLEELSAIGQTLALLITPDTGPMHLSAWTGLKCLNLSMGNVNPWETGPYPPGHTVIRADMECAHGCWHCTRSRLYCHDLFRPRRVAQLASLLVSNTSDEAILKSHIPGLTLSISSKKNGLYHLERMSKSIDEERLISNFWHSFFGYQFNLWEETLCQSAWTALTEQAPEAAQRLLTSLPEIGRQFQHGVKTGLLKDSSFWLKSPPIVKPLTGYLQMYLNNGDFARSAWVKSLQFLESLIACCHST